MDAVSGYPDGTFKPDSTITRGEFLKIAISTVENGSFYAGDHYDKHWTSGMYDYAVEKGIVFANEIVPTADALNKPITRYDMARIYVSVTDTTAW